MSIYLAGHWPGNVNRYPTEEDYEQAMHNLDRACYDTSTAILTAIDEGGENEEELWNCLERHLQGVSRCPITVDDAYGIALQSIEDVGTADRNDPRWDGYDMYDEGVENHASYHAGRPYECGGACPARIVYALEI